MRSASIGRTRFAGVVVATCCGLGLLGASSALAETKTFRPEGGSEQSFEVPAGVTHVTVSAIGGDGQAGGSCTGATGGAGGAGALVTATVGVGERETLHLDFGSGGNGGASNPSCDGGGGAGGGASDVLDQALAPVVVAGGGGGGGASYESFQGGGGGSALAAESAGGNGASGSLSPEFGGGGGEGGGVSAAGKGGAAGIADRCEPGGEGHGASGGAGGGPGEYEECEGGGGGGGGYYGGGGGGSSITGGGGGGAGSSYIDTVKGSGAFGVDTGKEKQEITISYTPPECTGNSGTVRLSPGLTDTPALQRVKVKGTLTGCTGEAFTEAKYTATLTTASKAACSALSGSGVPMSGVATYKWSPEARGTTTGALSMLLTERAGSAFSSELETGPYSPSTLSGTVSESYTNGPTCGMPKGTYKRKVINAVTKGSFTGSAVTFE